MMNTPINLYEFVMSHLRAKRIPQRQIAEESGVPFSTVCKIAQGRVTEPSVHTIQRLADYFSSKGDRRSSKGDRRSGNPDPLDE